MGDSLGYGAAFAATQRTRVGLVAMGYARWLPAHHAQWPALAVTATSAGAVGRVSHGHDDGQLTDLPGVRLGAEVQLWGPQVDINTIAAANNTIAYELMCHVQRVPRKVL